MLNEESLDKDLDGDFKLKAEFLSGGNERESVLQRSEKYAGWTLPHIFPDDTLTNDDGTVSTIKAIL